jgi:NAD(P)-dependent dehydrogenase (short-subunit alcohol dehydrogenase family)
MSNSHEGRVAIVTGAANGIGRAIALELGKRGARLVLIDLEECADTAAELDGHTLALRADVSQDEDWHRVAREVDARFGRCDIVVNNAAYMKDGTNISMAGGLLQVTAFGGGAFCIDALAAPREITLRAASLQDVDDASRGRLFNAHLNLMSRNFERAGEGRIVFYRAYSDPTSVIAAFAG